MDSSDEIKKMLVEIKEIQREHYERWKQAYENAMHYQAEAEQKLRHARWGAKFWTLLIIGAVLFMMFSPFLQTMMTMKSFRQQNESFLAEMKHYEAKEWLEKNPNPNALASNRFVSTQKALEFVNLLYEKGADAVYIAKVYDSESTIKGAKGLYSDTLIIVLPEKKMQRKEILKIFAAESLDQGHAPVPDKGQKELLMWWD